MGQTVADEGVQASGWVQSFSWILPGEMTKCSLPSLYINYQLLSRRHFVKEINETTSGQEQIRLPRREGGGGGGCSAWGPSFSPGAPVLLLLGGRIQDEWVFMGNVSRAVFKMCCGFFKRQEKIDSH